MIQNNLLIATHDSATGELPTWWSALLTPFARTQSKTIGEQIHNGCTLFDIRVKKVFGVWRCAHGWWFTKRTFKSIISELDFYAQCDKTIRVIITYEGKEKNASEFVEYIKDIKKQYQHIKYGPICAKYGNDTKGIKVNYSKPLIEEDKGWCPYKIRQAFLPLDGKTWHTFIPIPWIWKKLYYNKVSFNINAYKFVDFL
jgi:hypothetical protein